MHSCPPRAPHQTFFNSMLLSLLICMHLKGKAGQGVTEVSLPSFNRLALLSASHVGYLQALKNTACHPVPHLSTAWQLIIDKNADL